jgi:hypothetical protein
MKSAIPLPRKSKLIMRTILLVADSATILMAISSILSKVGAGTTATLWLPVATERASEPASSFSANE